jgi:Flp pilus assembly protein TadB
VEQNNLDDERDERGRLWSGLGNALNQAFEYAVISFLFGLAGYGLDKWTGLLPLFTIVFVVVAFVGLFARMWYSYDAAMKAEEARAPWGRKATSP